MKIAKSLLAIAALGSTMAAPFPAGAHHSFAMFDRTKCEVIEGTVSRFTLVYPHSWIWIMVQNEDGSETRWAFEGLDPASARVRGWMPNSLRAGEEITVAFHPLRDGRPGGAYEEVRKTDGTVLGGAMSACKIDS